MKSQTSGIGEFDIEMQSWKEAGEWRNQQGNIDSKDKKKEKLRFMNILENPLEMKEEPWEWKMRNHLFVYEIDWCIYPIAIVKKSYEWTSMASI